MKIPCFSCEHFNSIDPNTFCCYAVDEINFYSYSTMADMINLCPRGFRAKQTSDKNIKCWREYDKVHHL